MFRCSGENYFSWIDCVTIAFWLVNRINGFDEIRKDYDNSMVAKNILSFLFCFCHPRTSVTLICRTVWNQFLKVWIIFLFKFCSFYKHKWLEMQDEFTCWNHFIAFCSKFHFLMDWCECPLYSISFDFYEMTVAIKDDISDIRVYQS